MLISSALHPRFGWYMSDRRRNNNLDKCLHLSSGRSSILDTIIMTRVFSDLYWISYFIEFMGPFEFIATIGPEVF